jgi:hypothetical protein
LPFESGNLLLQTSFAKATLPGRTKIGVSDILLRALVSLWVLTREVEDFGFGGMFPCPLFVGNGGGETADGDEGGVGVEGAADTRGKEAGTGLVTIHHAGELWTKGEDPVEFVRHMQVWGQNRPKLEKPPRDTYWPDLPYHYLIAPDGRIFEGRPVDYEPESNTKYSLKGNIGIEMMGDFNEQRPSVEQIKSCVALTAWLCGQYHIDLDHVRTHQDAAPNQTDCPGKDFYRYIIDGEFKNWVKEAMQGKNPKIEPGAPLQDGPTKPIVDG